VAEFQERFWLIFFPPQREMDNVWTSLVMEKATAARSELSYHEESHNDRDDSEKRNTYWSSNAGLVLVHRTELDTINHNLQNYYMCLRQNWIICFCPPVKFLHASQKLFYASRVNNSFYLTQCRRVLYYMLYSWRHQQLLQQLQVFTNWRGIVICTPAY
jgi:hypothetical protein